MTPSIVMESADLKKLWDEGYVVEIRDRHLLVHQIPYVNSQKKIKRGTLLTTLNLNADKTLPPDTHVLYFIGEYPCHKNGEPIQQLSHQTNINHELLPGTIVNHSFSNKPLGGAFSDYYEKISSYIRIISNPAKSIDENVKERTFEVVESMVSESVFQYLDTNSSRAEIIQITNKLSEQRVGIIGLGGTGGYILDFLSKAPLLEIHLFDGDDFCQHNAFRAPGAAPKEKLYDHLKKTDYLMELYSKIHRFIYSHPVYINKANVELLKGLTFVFISMDSGPDKGEIMKYLVDNSIGFIDVGLGIEESDGSLFGIMRTTLCVPEKTSHIAPLVSVSDKKEEGIYDQNIQIAELNAMNAALAVIKWKKYLTFYKDHERELNSTYTVHLNEIINDNIQL